jgi:hypothetical protein
MHKIEADWLCRKILLLYEKNVNISPILNLGSSSSEFREVSQPHINSQLFSELSNMEIPVLHCDLKCQQGVDIVGDILDPVFRISIKNRKIKYIICSNVLEHISSPKYFAESILEIIDDGGYIFITCPRRYPYHPDPIDTMFRPTPEDLSGLFPKTRLIDKIVLYPERSGILELIKTNPLEILRLMLPFYKFHSWKCRIFGYAQSCIILQKV